MTIIMKSILILIICLCCVHAEQWPSPKFLETINPVTKKCISETGIDENLITNVKRGDIPDNDKLKEYLVCIFKTFDLIDYEHHEFEYWKLLSMVPQEMKKPIFEMGKGCIHINGEDYGKACIEFLKCLHKANSERFAFMI